MKKDYYIGLDMGTSSVGWAVTDTNYKILRAKGKDLWGVREFDPANGAEDTRSHRIARRRRQREAARLGMLKGFFKEEIAKKDEAFFFRLEESKYHTDDKKTGTKYTLFADHAYTDKEYFETYPTIFHLRKELIENENEHDIRLIYLAVANMFKHRGHFLNAGLSAENSASEVNELFAELTKQIQEQQEKWVLSTEQYETHLESILSDRNLSRTQKTEQLAQHFGVAKKDKEQCEILKAICGQKVKPVLWFGEEVLDEENAKISFSFRDDTEEIMDKLAVVLDVEQMDFLSALKAVHDAGCLSSIMKGYPYLSYARVGAYEKHKKDLQCLKKVIQEYLPEQYDEMFREMKEGNYSAYVGSVNSDKEKKRRNIKGRKRDDLYAKIKKMLKDVPDFEEKKYILQEMEKETFLPKQLTSENGIIPNQVHLAELQAILANAEKYHTFLAEKDEQGLSVTEKICRLFAFQIPYYVGPLKNTETNRAWVVRKQQGTVYPWNLHDMVDLKATNEAFIENMVGNCTYLRNEKVLPKTSLLHEKFQVLNELNNLRVAGERLTAEQKQELYNTLFLRGKKITRNTLEKYLIGKGILQKGMEAEISGIDGDFKSALTSYGKFHGVFGDDMQKDSVQKIAEDIIFWGTVYGDDKNLFMERVQEVYGEVLDKEQLKKIKGFKFREWGRLSREFLEMSGCSKEDGEVLPLIQMMWENNVNLMELMSDRYTYADVLKERTEEIAKSLQTLEYEDLDGMYLAAPVKRMIWQTILVLNEVVSVMGCEPKKVFVEMAREDGEKGKRNVSRQKQLLEAYKKCKKDPVAVALMRTLEGRDEKELRQKKLYLYYMQKARCMYTGQIIEIDELFNDNLYDIDHIYPRHFVKDDSIINNLVLVRKEENAHKSDTYPLESSIRHAHSDWWKSLLDDGFISAEKYKRLTGRTPFTDEQMEGFINRQLVETRQGTKALAKVMEMAFDHTEVVYVKAGLAADFRKDFNILKSRAVNDFHHAQDAYLNIVVGNVYNTKFTKDPRNFIKAYREDPDNHKYHMDKVFYHDVKRGSETAWITKGDQKSIDMVRKMVDKNSPIITRMSFEVHGKLFDLNPVKAKEQNGYVPLKTTDQRMQDVMKYGGYNSIKGTYFFLVEYEMKKKKVRTLEFMPLYLKDKIGDDTEALEAYCRECLGMVNPSVRLKKIKFQSLFKVNGYYMHLSGRTEDRLTMRNAVSLCLKREWVNYIKKVEKIVEKGFAEKEITAEKNQELYDILVEKIQKGIFSKRPNPVGEKLQESRDAFVVLSKEEQCKVILEILRLTALGLTEANLTQINGGAKTGTMKISKKISGVKEFKLIHQSPAGLYKTELDLLTV